MFKMHKKNKAIDVLHVYYSSPGMAGLYIREIYNGLKYSGYRQKLITNYYYPFKEDAYKVFFRWTDLSAGTKFTAKLRLILRFIELCVGLCASFLIIIKCRPKCINYSLTNTFLVERSFLMLVKRVTGTKVYITCHDVVPFQSNYVCTERAMIQRSKFFKLADRLIVHNENSRDDLITFYNVIPNKIKMYRFPIMDATELKQDVRSESMAKQWDFCVIGILRNEKGLDLMVNAWRVFSEKYPNAKLVIAGYVPLGNEKMRAAIDELPLDFVDRYLSDEEYVHILMKSRYIILPYKRGTNSGIPSTALSLGAEVIASDIPMFQNNCLILRDFLCKADSKDDLVAKMERAYMTTSNKRSEAEIRQTMQNYKSDFIRELDEVYYSFRCDVEE